MAAAAPKEAEASPFEEAARKDSAVHVSLSSDSPVKQLRNLAAPSPDYAGAAETRTSDMAT